MRSCDYILNYGAIETMVEGEFLLAIDLLHQFFNFINVTSFSLQT
ncbi:hypothetical protein CKA32_004995 [Geitlerinema sp. FC II]|nr:hypothetical protein CKA32_004995 [Geitlerinema sp. FC II]